jgi:streptogramin lyase
VGTFEQVSTFRQRGGVLAEIVGPGPEPGSERLYQSYIYTGTSLEIVAVNPITGEAHVFPSPVPGESGAWGLALGPDGNIYVGTLPHAHLFRLDPRRGVLEDIGRPSESEQYIWQLTAAPDGRLYGCTYPSARLVRFDPATGRSEDLGRLDAEEQYARSLAATADGFVYVGIGTRHAGVVAYDIAGGSHRQILPEQHRTAGTAAVHRGSDGRAYAQMAGQWFRLERWEALSVSADEAASAPARNQLRDGRRVETSDGVVRLRRPDDAVETVGPYPYAGGLLSVFRLACGPDGKLYGSGVLPAHFFAVDPQGGEQHYLGQVGGGEVYSMVRQGEQLLLAAYSGLAPLMRFDPRRPFAPDTTAEGNPVLVTYPEQVNSWRPMAMIAGSHGDIYLGAVSGYGTLGGPLTVWNPATNRIDSYPHLVPDQSVVTLAMAGDLVAGGTSVGGGGGSRPTQTEARLFLWDPRSRQKQFETAPVPGARELTDLIQAPNGLLFGIAGGTTLFVFDCATRMVMHTAPLPFRGVPYNCVALGPDGQIWGLANAGVFRVDPATYVVHLVAEAPEPVTAGFALLGDQLYFACGANIWRYTPN